ncbi:hypothetical protein [Sulfobacillus thermosulfidooxidans]|uniref:hypothetical protein n=1 Tax=Sulfobacillus thermosulfidooxidans TaxID=28034 RepID=UPI0006B6989F|nr:hypothetical protein [Sulfobacillus thermosulfidooxidans]
MITIAKEKNITKRAKNKYVVRISLRNEQCGKWRPLTETSNEDILGNNILPGSREISTGLWAKWTAGLSE